jgi:hypothetical protein
VSFALAPALWGLLVLPVLVLLRILDRRPRVVVVPSLIPWRAAADAARPEGRRRVLLDWPLVLQLLAAAAVVLGAAGPRISGKAAGPRPVVVVLDNSVSMAARSAGGTTRFAQAKDRVRRLLSDGRRPVGILAAAVATAPHPRVFYSGGFDVSFDVLHEVRQVPFAGDLPGAVAAARAAGGPGALVVVATDDLTPIEGQPAGDLVTIRVGAPVRNLGIVAATVEDGRVFAAVRNASTAPEKARLTLTLLSSGKEAASREAVIEAGGRTAFTFQLPADLTGQVELRLPPDDLEADNVVRLSAEPPPRPVFVGRPAPSFARALQALGFAEASASSAGAGTRAGLTVSCGLWPRTAPGFTLVIDPPVGELSGITAEDQTFPAEIRLGEGDPGLFPGAAGFSFRAPSVRKLKAGGGRVLLGAAEGPAIVLSADGSTCVLAFDPEATEWVKHESFPVFLARLAERAGAFGTLCRGIRPEGLLSDEETACRVAGREIREVGAAGRALPVSGGRPLAPWLFALALALLAAEWWLASRSGPRATS